MFLEHHGQSSHPRTAVSTEPVAEGVIEVAPGLCSPSACLEPDPSGGRANARIPAAFFIPGRSSWRCRVALIPRRSCTTRRGPGAKSLCSWRRWASPLRVHNLGRCAGLRGLPGAADLLWTGMIQSAAATGPQEHR